MKVLHILDVSNYIYVYNFTKQSASRGVREVDGYYVNNTAPVGGVIGLAREVKKIISQGEYVLLCFDRYAEVNKELYQQVFGFKGYKAQRPTNDKIHIQKDFAERVMRYIGVPCCAQEQHEADDLIFTAVCKYKDEFDHIRVHTNDSDLAFLIDNTVSLQKVGKEPRIITVENYDISLFKNLEIAYNSILFQKLCFGDTADNIKGLGRKWAFAIDAYIDSEGYSWSQMGDVNLCRKVLVEVMEKNPDLPNSNRALDLFSLLTPKKLQYEYIEEPINNIDLKKLNYVINLTKPSGDSYGIEDYLSEYLTEYFR